MVSKYLTHVIKQDIVTKTSFFTAGELLDIYLLNEQTVSVALRNTYNYVSLYRKYTLGVHSLLQTFNGYDLSINNLFYNDKLIRVYYSPLGNIGGTFYIPNMGSFDYTFFNGFVWLQSTGMAPERLSYSSISQSIELYYPLVKIQFLNQHMLHKLSPIFKIGIGLFIPHDGSTAWGGTSYAGLLCSQKPEIIFDYLINLFIPSMIFNFDPDIIHNRGSLVELQNYFVNTYKSAFSLNSILSKEFNVLLSNAYYFNNNLLNLTYNNVFTLYERSKFYTSNGLGQFLHENEDLEYYENSRAPYNSIIYSYGSLIVNKIFFLDTVYNLSNSQHIDSIGTNYVRYIHRHENGEVIIDHRDIPAIQLALLWFWGGSHLSVFKLERIRVKNIVFKYYLDSYETKLFARENAYSFEIDYIDEITEEGLTGEYDLSRNLEEFHEDDNLELVEIIIPEVYFWDKDDNKSIWGIDSPFAYLDIFFDQFQYNDYYYETDEMAKNYKVMAFKKSYDMKANGYKGIVYDDNTEHEAFSRLLVGTLNVELNVVHNFYDEASKSHWRITSYFERDIILPQNNIVTEFLTDRSIDLSLVASIRLNPILGLTTYSLDNQSQLFSNFTKHTIEASKHDIEFPAFYSTKFRRV